MSALAPRRRPAAVLALAVVALAVLVGCTTAGQTEEATTMPTPTADTAETGTCTDGFMLVDMDVDADDADDADADADDSPVVVSDTDCDLVSIVGSGGTVRLGTVGTLVVEGTSVGVTVDQVATVRIAGADNVVTHGGDAPTTEDAGTGNSVVPAA